MIMGAPVSIFLGGENWTATALEIVLKHVFFKKTLLHFAQLAYLIIVSVKSCMQKRKAAI